MSADGSITRWINDLREGHSVAASRLWERFFDRMKHLARPRARPQLTGGVYDEEDVALSAFASFCRALQAGKYPQMQDRNDLWQLLATFTLRKANDHARHERAEKRGGPGLAQRLPEAAGPGADPLGQVASDTPPPDLLVLMGEECQRLLDRLADPELQAVAMWRLEGYTNDEI